jgi:hypothetical protein
MRPDDGSLEWAKENKQEKNRLRGYHYPDFDKINVFAQEYMRDAIPPGTVIAANDQEPTTMREILENDDRARRKVVWRHEAERTTKGIIPWLREQTKKREAAKRKK